MLTALAFAVWMTFFDQNDLISMRQKKADLKAASRNIEYMNQEIARMEKEHSDLLTNRQKLEQFARENYRMKKDNEDVYVIDRK